METSKPIVRRSTIATTKKSPLTIKQSQNKPSALFPSDPPSKPSKSSKNLSKNPIISPSDLSDIKTFQRQIKPGKLTIPARSSLISPSDLSELSSKQSKVSHQYSHSTLVSQDQTLKNSKEITLDIKKCLKELKDEAEQCLNSSRKANKNKSGLARTPAEADEDFKDSFTTKTPLSTDLVDDQKSPMLKQDDVLDMKLKIDLLVTKMMQSESEAREHELENQKLKETIKGLEHKIDDFRFYGDKGVSCSGNCVVF